MKSKPLYSASMLFALFLTTLHAFADPLIFVTAPTDSETDTVDLYQPLVTHMAKVLNRPIEIRTYDNFIEFTSHMRKDYFDIVFDGPHFVSWRMDNIGHRPVVRLNGNIAIVVAIRDSGSRIENIKDIEMGKGNVCAFASPNLLTMAFLSQFTNPIRQPRMLRMQGFKEITECLQTRRGEVAVYRDVVWNKMDKAGMKLLDFPKIQYPERTISVSSRISDKEIALLKQELLNDEAAKISAEMFKNFKKKAFIDAKTEDYDGLGKLLAQVWGFRY